MCENTSVITLANDHWPLHSDQSISEHIPPLPSPLQRHLAFPLSPVAGHRHPPCSWTTNRCIAPVANQSRDDGAGSPNQPLSFCYPPRRTVAQNRTWPLLRPILRCIGCPCSNLAQVTLEGTCWTSTPLHPHPPHPTSPSSSPPSKEQNLLRLLCHDGHPPLPRLAIYMMCSVGNHLTLSIDLCIFCSIISTA